MENLHLNTREQIKQHIREPNFNVAGFKVDFCAEHDLDWNCTCWLCTIFSYCKECPLQNCLKGKNNRIAAYLRVVSRHEKSACDEIIKAIKSIEVPL